MTIFELSDGWTAEELKPVVLEQVLLTSPDRLMVTVDFARRGFRSGLVMSGRMTSTKTYAGRAWKQKLIDDAMQHLIDVAKRRK